MILAGVFSFTACGKTGGVNDLLTLLGMAGADEPKVKEAKWGEAKWGTGKWNP